MKKTNIALIFTIILSSALFAAGQSQKDLVIKTARALETSPLSPDTIAMREKALKWVIETNDVSVNVCGGIFSLFSDKKNKNSPDMTTSYTLSMAAFKLENPGATDENDAQLAGLESALKTYEAIVKEKPKTRNEKIDALVQKRADGQLAALVKSVDCGKK